MYIPGAASRRQHRVRARGWRERGQSLVEFALILPIVVLLTMGLLMFGVIFGAQITLTEAAAAGARQAVVEEYCPLPSSSHHNTEIRQAVINAMGWLGMANIQTITVYKAAADGSVAGGIQDIFDKDGNQAGAYSFTNGERCGLVATYGYIGVKVTYRQVVFVPFINLVIGNEIVLRGQRIEIMRP